MGPKQLMAKENSGSNEIWGPNKLEFKNFRPAKKFVVQNFWVKKIGSKWFGMKISFGPIKFSPKIFEIKKTLGSKKIMGNFHNMRKYICARACMLILMTDI